MDTLSEKDDHKTAGVFQEKETVQECVNPPIQLCINTCGENLPEDSRGSVRPVAPEHKHDKESQHNRRGSAYDDACFREPREGFLQRPLVHERDQNHKHQKRNRIDDAFDHDRAEGRALGNTLSLCKGVRAGELSRTRENIVHHIAHHHAENKLRIEMPVFTGSSIYRHLHARRK